MKPQSLDEASAIFAAMQIGRGADARDWDRVRETFAPIVELDYGTPEQLTPDEIVARWRPLLEGFDSTEHDVSKVRVELKGDEALVFADFRATHCIEGAPGGALWILCGRYEWRLVWAGARWTVAAMKMIPLESLGNEKLVELARERAAAAQPRPG